MKSGMVHPINTITAYKGQFVYDTPATQGQSSNPGVTTAVATHARNRPTRHSAGNRPGRPAATTRTCPGRRPRRRRGSRRAPHTSPGDTARAIRASPAAGADDAQAWPVITRTACIRPLRLLAALGSTLAVVSGCQFGGLNSIDMPGTVGHGPGSFTITVELPDVSTLPQNSPVLVDDVTVGSVSGHKVMQRPDGTFYAVLQLSLSSTVRLPANAIVTVGQTSLLGSQHVELAAPSTEPPTGALGDGASIPLQRAGRYPSTEEVLSTLGVVVNKGNLGALQDITDELYSAVAGHAGQFADLLPRLADLTAAVDRQASDIVNATESVSRVASKFADNDATVTAALAALPDATRTLNANAGRIVDTFAALRRFSEYASRILAQTKTDITADITDAYAVVKPLTDHAQQLIDALPILATYPFPQTGIKQAVRGDYLNAIATLDLTQRRFGENLFTTSPLDPNMKHLSQILTAPDFLVGEQANLSGRAANPFALPPSPSTPAVPGPR